MQSGQITVKIGGLLFLSGSQVNIKVEINLNRNLRFVSKLPLWLQIIILRLYGYDKLSLITISNHNL